jgi:outer membrane protein assembly factor BamB
MRTIRTLATTLILSMTSVLPALAAPGEQQAELADFPKLSAERDWPWWRGPGRNGIAPDVANAKPPTQWSETENVLWKAEVPGRGHASPIIVAGRVYLATADELAQTQSVVAFDAETGKQLWKTDMNKGGLPGKIHEKNTHASPTVACDGEKLYTLTNHHTAVHLTALDLTGKVLWDIKAADFDSPMYPFGYAPSPVLYRDKVLVAAESDGERSLIAFDRTAGKELWRTRLATHTSYSTPSIARAAGKDQIVMSGGDRITAFDPETGKQTWSAPGTAAATCGTAVWEGDIVIASGGYPKSNTSAIKADGSGKVLWSVPQKLYEPSLLAYQGQVFGFTGNGMMYCWRIADGKEMWKQRLQGPVSASAIVAGGHIYWANERGVLYVFKASGEKFELVAENKLGEESMASPAIVGGKLFLRVASGRGQNRKETLYCIGNK